MRNRDSSRRAWSVRQEANESDDTWVELGMNGSSAAILERFERKALKEKYLACFDTRSSNTAQMVEAVKGLVRLGISRKILVRWAVGAGYNLSHVRSLLSRIFCALGLRERAAGAGRKSTPEALELLAHARQRYGDRSLKVLRAAWRAGKAWNSGDKLRSEARIEGIAGRIVSPRLPIAVFNCGTTIS